MITAKKIGTQAERIDMEGEYLCEMALLVVELVEVELVFDSATFQRIPFERKDPQKDRETVLLVVEIVADETEKVRSEENRRQGQVFRMGNVRQRMEGSGNQRRIAHLQSQSQAAPQMLQMD
jgi:hypothetical protein